eukprot:symbB.v1.2.009313.t1/scaffold585.1/size314277/3
MAGTWRVLVESLHDLGTASYRVGDHLKLIGHSLQGGDGNDPHLRNLVVEVKSGNKTMRTPPFSAAVGQSDIITLNEVLFVSHPPLREGATLRVLKLHKHQSDALVGEATITQPKGAMVLKLMRKGTPQGIAMVTVTTGLPQMKPKAKAFGSSPTTPPIQSEHVDSPGPGTGEDSMKSGQSRTSRATGNSRPGAAKGPTVVNALAPATPPAPRDVSNDSSVPPIPDERTPAKVPLPSQAPAESTVATGEVDIFSHLLACSAGLLKGAAELCSKTEEGARSR